MNGKRCATRIISRAPKTKEVRPPGAEEAARTSPATRKAFTAAIRTRIFTFLRGLIIGDYEQALAGSRLGQTQER